jgi:hypothetical protein
LCEIFKESGKKGEIMTIGEYCENRDHLTGCNYKSLYFYTCFSFLLEKTDIIDVYLAGTNELLGRVSKNTPLELIEVLYL